MHRFLVHLANVFLLVLIVIGIPAITSLRFGSIRLSSDPKLQMLTLTGLGLAAATNLVGALFAVTDKKGRRACWTWALLFGLILAVEYCYFRSYIRFGWLKEALLWVQNHF
jgi:hypothetical protein